MAENAAVESKENTQEILKEDLELHGHNLADFTPSEQACISKNISEKVKEGWEKDRAIAASISICAPEKSKSKMSDEELRQMAEQFQDDPDRICGHLWFDGTSKQRDAFGSGTEGKGHEEKPPKAWWDD